uniref:Unclassified n=1 Tax=Fusarium clavum TaxID=2594811 RepID=W1I9T3_9HYPO|nr:unclassified [Fusarium clavum]CEF82691.1 unclassified [Fusarium clavum]
MSGVFESCVENVESKEVCVWSNNWYLVADKLIANKVRYVYELTTDSL